VHDAKPLVEIVAQMGCAEDADFPVEQFLGNISRVIVGTEAVKIF